MGRKRGDAGLKGQAWIDYWAARTWKKGPTGALYIEIVPYHIVYTNDHNDTSMLTYVINYIDKNKKEKPEWSHAKYNTAEGAKQALLREVASRLHKLDTDTNQ
jgi:hypothetical protein